MVQYHMHNLLYPNRYLLSSMHYRGQYINILCNYQYLYMIHRAFDIFLYYLHSTSLLKLLQLYRLQEFERTLMPKCPFMHCQTLNPL